METLLTNKYFCVAVLVALVVMVYLYINQTDYCSVEGLQNVNLTPLGQELVKDPGTNRVNDKFDREADAYVKNKHKIKNFLPRADVSYRKYMESSDEIDSTPIHLKHRKKSSHSFYPQPLDTRPDLSQCQPCKCDKK